MPHYYFNIFEHKGFLNKKLQGDVRGNLNKPNLKYRTDRPLTNKKPTTQNSSIGFRRNT